MPIAGKEGPSVTTTGRGWNWGCQATQRGGQEAIHWTDMDAGKDGLAGFISGFEGHLRTFYSHFSPLNERPYWIL